MAYYLHFNGDLINAYSYDNWPVYIYPPTDNFSVCCWVYLDSDHPTGSYYNIIASDDAYSGYGITFGLETHDKVYLWNTGTAWPPTTWVVNSTALTKTAWHFVAATFTATDESVGTATVYVDSTSNNSTSFPRIAPDYSNIMLMGNCYNGGGAYTGMIRQLVWSDTCWSSANVASLYNSGSGVADPKSVVTVKYQWQINDGLGATSLADSKDSNPISGFASIDGVTWKLFGSQVINEEMHNGAKGGGVAALSGTFHYNIDMVGGAKGGSRAYASKNFGDTVLYDAGVKGGDTADVWWGRRTYTEAMSGGAELDDTADVGTQHTYNEAMKSGVKGGSAALSPVTRKPITPVFDGANSLANGCVCYIPLCEGVGTNVSDISSTSCTATFNSSDPAVIRWIKINGDVAVQNIDSFLYIEGHPSQLDFTGDHTLVWYGYFPDYITATSTGVIGRASYDPKRGDNMQPHNNTLYVGWSSDGLDPAPYTSGTFAYSYPSAELFTGVYSAGNYVDGYTHTERIAHETSGIPATFYFPPDLYWQIMARGDSGPLPGIVLGLGIWNRALSADEIALLNRDFWALAKGLLFGGSKLGGTLQPKMVYGENFTSGAAGSGEAFNQVIGPIISARGGAKAGGYAGTSRAYFTKPTTPVWDGANSLANGCVCYMPFCNSLTDLTGTVSASAVESPTWTTSGPGICLDCNGTSQYVTLGDPASLRFAGDHTLAWFGRTPGWTPGWADWNSCGGSETGLIAKYDDYNNGGSYVASGFEVVSNDPGYVYIVGSVKGTVSPFISNFWSDPELPIQPWDLWVLTFQHLVCKLYQNGSLVLTYDTGIAEPFVNNDELPWNVMTNGSHTLYTPGKIQGVALWSRALSPDDVAVLDRDFFALAKGLLFGGSTAGGIAAPRMTYVENFQSGGSVGGTEGGSLITFEAIVGNEKAGGEGHDWMGFGKQYNEEMYGGVKVINYADVQSNYSVDGTGGGAVGGIAAFITDEVMQGGVELYGDSWFVKRIYPAMVKSGVALGGEFDLTRCITPHIRKSGIKVGGYASVPFDQHVAGGVRISGTGWFGNEISMTGGIIASGGYASKAQFRVLAEGGISAGGVGQPGGTDNYWVAGGIRASGRVADLTDEHASGGIKVSGLAKNKMNHYRYVTDILVEPTSTASVYHLCFFRTRVSGSITVGGTHAGHIGLGYIASGSVSIAGAAITAIPGRACVSHGKVTLGGDTLCRMSIHDYHYTATGSIRIAGKSDFAITFLDQSCSANKCRCTLQQPNEHLACIPDLYFYGDVRILTPQTSRLRTATKLAPIIACRQRFYLPLKDRHPEVPKYQAL